MDNMIVEFDTVRGSLKESFDNDAANDLGVSTSFDKSFDYISKIALNLDLIIGFVGGKIYYNGQELDCVYAEEKDNHTVGLLIKYEDFKKLYERQNNITIQRWEKLI